MLFISNSMAAAHALMEFGMVPLLRVAWVAATLPILAASVPGGSMGFFRRLLVGFAARGKTMQPSTKARFLFIYILFVKREHQFCPLRA